MTVREALRLSRKDLEERAGESSGREAELLLADALGCGRLFIYAEGASEMPKDAEERLLSALSRRKRGEPLQHILGSVDFMGVEVKTDKRALIPRPETELLAELAACRADSMHADHPERPFRILDLCCGSGCLAEYLASACPYASVTASDISEEALSLAAENCGENVELRLSDLFESIDGRFSLIISNPPYIPSAVIEGLQPEVRDFEPRLALDGGADGLDLIRRIIDGAPACLEPGGALMMEIGYDQGGEVLELARRAGFADPEIVRDLNGLDRFLTAVLPRNSK